MSYLQQFILKILKFQLISKRSKKNLNTMEKLVAVP